MQLFYMKAKGEKEMEIRSSAITKRKDGRYQAYAYASDKKRHYVYDTNRQTCRAKLTALIEEMQAGIISTNMLFKDYIEKWKKVDCANHSPTSQDRTSRKIAGHIIPALGDLKLKEIKKNDIQKFMNEFCKTRSEKYSKDIVAIIHRILESARADSLIKSNPCKNITVKKTAPYKYNIYTIEEMLEFVEVIKGTEFEIPVLLAAFCGLRLSEVCGLKWDKVDFKENTITIDSVAVDAYGKVVEKIPKTKTSIRTLPMPELVADSLKRVRGLASGYVCPGKDGLAQNGKNLSKRLARFRKNKGFPDTRFHDLRHFYATVMLINNVSLKQVAQTMGHSTTNMTQKYQHILKSMESRPANIINDITKNIDLTPDLTPKQQI